MESFVTNVHIVGEDLLKAFYKLFYLRFFILSDQWKKRFVAKILEGNYGTFFCTKIILTTIPTSLVTNLLLYFFVLSKKPKIRINVQWVGGLVIRNISLFCLLQVALYFKVMTNSIDFYKTIFLHVIPVCIIVSCLDAAWVG